MKHFVIGTVYIAIFVIGVAFILEVFTTLNLKEARDIGVKGNFYLGTWAGVGLFVILLWCLLAAIIGVFWEPYKYKNN